MKTLRFLLVVSVAFGQCLQCLRAETDLDDLEGAVVMLRSAHPVVRNVNGKDYEVWLKNPETGEFVQPPPRVPAGTGFLVTGKKGHFLVTAGHIASDMGTNCIVTVRGSDNLPLDINLIDLIDEPPTNSGLTTLWHHHRIADCAVHPIIEGRAGFSNLSHAASISVDMLKTDSNAPPKTDLLTILGFALGYGIQVTFAPITKESKPASGLRSENEVNFFLLQDPGIDGFSGAPVFRSGAPRVIAPSPNSIGIAFGGATCWGLLSRTDNDSSGGKMARIIHSGHIVELITEFETTLPPNLKTPVAANATPPSNRTNEK